MFAFVCVSVRECVCNEKKTTACTQVQIYRGHTSPRLPRAHKSKSPACTQVQGDRVHTSPRLPRAQIQGYCVHTNPRLPRGFDKMVGVPLHRFFCFLYHSYSFMIHPWIQSHGDHPHVGENPPYMSGGGEDHSSTKIRRNFYLNLGVFLWRGGLRFLFVDHFSKKKNNNNKRKHLQPQPKRLRKKIHSICFLI